ncbi:MAG: CPBP family intramembrane glutamic endopeptidase [Cyclobacteriaceae bacterium]
MKHILSLVKEHTKQDFNIFYYLSLFLLITLSLTLNYFFDIENSWIDRETGNPIRIVLYFVLYGFGYYSTCLVVSYFKPNTSFLTSGKFWLFSLFGLSVLSIDSGFPFLHNIISSLNQSYQAYSWLYKIGTNTISFLLVLAPLYLFYRFIDTEKNGFYGLLKKSSLNPYVALLLIISPFIILASFQKSFTDYYPIYKSNSLAELWHWPAFTPALLFEIFYGADFLPVELLFRGFFVIGMAQILGKHSILPMVVVYCFLHFGKPAGEAVSSIFGGYVLGVIALYTQSIWGGIIIHVGVAWMMELAAYVARQF